MSRRPVPKPRPVELEHAPGSPLSKMLPEITVVALVCWLLISDDASLWVNPDGLLFAAMADGATLMMSGTLIDIATRLKRAPPWWVAPLAIGGILLLYPESITILKESWNMGMWVFLPFAWSVLERVREIWTLPAASKLERIRRRVLTFDRLYTALAVGGLCIVATLILVLLFGVPLEAVLSPLNLLWPMLGFYAINAANVIRVHRPSFARSAKSLWPKMDGGQGTDLDPL
ncbi:MAG: hypothetical protein ACT4NL_11190 [Pseudomarimonas sp.]